MQRACVIDRIQQAEVMRSPANDEVMELTTEGNSIFLVSVVIPTFNSAGSLADTLKSVFAQQHVAKEVVIIDGGSSDGTLAIVQQYGEKIAHCISEPDNGPYDAMNQGVQRTRGGIIAILNSDDRWKPQTLARIVDVFKQEKSAGIVHGNVYYHYPDGSGQIIRPSRGLSRSVGLGLPFVHPAAFVSRATYERIGLYDLRYRICADQEFAYRCFRKGVRDVYLDEPLTEMKAGGLSFRIDYRKEIEDIIDTFPTVRKSIARFLWTGLGRDTRYFNGATDLPLWRAILRAAKGKTRNGLRRPL
jgi:glycosyltransferase involved in cell wall biosynthesis